MMHGLLPSFHAYRARTASTSDLTGKDFYSTTLSTDHNFIAFYAVCAGKIAQIIPRHHSGHDDGAGRACCYGVARSWTAPAFTSRSP
jgi:hypothetical protein